MNVQELLWKYAEGRCCPKERVEVEQLTSQNAGLQQDLAIIRKVQATLTTMELEQPSMRFVQQVMEHLPKRHFAAEPLIKPFWKKTFWIALAASMVAVFFSTATGNAVADPVGQYAGAVLAAVNVALEAVPPMVLQYFVLVILTFVILAVLDKTLSLRKHMNFF
ncbi:MAG: hypothetical protein EPO28_11165 [Saprospiraceae bacterium]|nr:MAG: hypothetical protein EPO28_11165 [Saprospiraceae bacterium]